MSLINPRMCAVALRVPHKSTILRCLPLSPISPSFANGAGNTGYFGPRSGIHMAGHGYPEGTPDPDCVVDGLTVVSKAFSCFMQKFDDIWNVYNQYLVKSAILFGALC